MGNNDDIFMARYSAFNPYRIRHNDMGYQRPIGYGDAMARSLYCGMKPIATWMSDNVNCVPTGGVFNLEFSPEGYVLEIKPCYPSGLYTTSSLYCQIAKNVCIDKIY